MWYWSNIVGNAVRDHVPAHNERNTFVHESSLCADPPVFHTCLYFSDEETAIEKIDLFRPHVDLVSTSELQLVLRECSSG